MRRERTDGRFRHYPAGWVLALVFPVSLYGNPVEDAWLDAHEDVQTATVNEGVLTFLDQPPDSTVHAHHNRITLSRQSLHDGWAGLNQCHTDLDPVAAAEVVFNPGRVRNLQVEKVTGIGRAWVDGVSVQLEDIVPGAELCLSGETRVVVPQAGGGFLVRNGPFMRRFLDGFYPLHVTLQIELPPGNWTLARSQPQVQPGFEIVRTARGLDVDAWFEGELHTEFHFAPTGGENRMNHMPREQE